MHAKGQAPHDACKGTGIARNHAGRRTTRTQGQAEATYSEAQGHALLKAAAVSVELGFAELI